MALQIYTPFTADRSIVQGGLALGQGIAGAGAAAGNAITRIMDENKQRTAQAKKIRAMAKLLKEEIGLSDAEVEAADAETLSGTIEGFMRQSLVEKDRRAAQYDMERINSLMAERRQQELAPQFAGEFNRLMNLPGPVRNTPSEAMLSASQTTGYNLPPSVMDDILRNSNQGAQAPKGLPLGTVVPVGDLGSIVGTGEEFEPNFVPKTKASKEEVEIQNYPWLFTQDKDEFTKGIMALEPKKRDAAIATRTAYNRSIGRQEDPLLDAFNKIVESRGVQETKPESPKKAKPAFRFNPQTRMLEPVP